MPSLYMNRPLPLKREKNIHRHYQCYLHSIHGLYTWYVDNRGELADAYAFVLALLQLLQHLFVKT